MNATDSPSGLTDALLAEAATMAGFSELILGQPLYDWQAEILGWFDNFLSTGRLKAAVCTPNGAGKSRVIIAGLALAWIALYPRGRVVVTTADGKQLDNQVFAALESHRGTLPILRFKRRHVQSPTGGEIIGFTTDEPGRAEGWHKLDDFNGPLLIIVDEAKTVAEPIFQAFDRCSYNALLYISSPGMMQGRFYDAFTRRAASFRTRRAGLADCPHIDQARIQNTTEEYGADHPFTRSTLHGEFMDQDEANRFVFPLAELQATLANPPLHRPGERFGFCDFAAGGDENVFALAEGNRVSLTGWKELDTASATGRFLNLFREHAAPASGVWGDEGGMGVAICDRMREQGFDIQRENNGEAALDTRYQNRGAEMWHEAAAAVRRGEIIVPDDPTLHAQLTTRRATLDSRGRLGVEKKEEMRKRGLKSPDRADAFCGAACAFLGKMKLARTNWFDGSY